MGFRGEGVKLPPPSQRFLVFKYPSRDRVNVVSLGVKRRMLRVNICLRRGATLAHVFSEGGDNLFID